MKPVTYDKSVSTICDEHNLPPELPLVFISYSDADCDVAEKICSAMEADGIRYWIAHRNIEPGEKWIKKISEAMEGAKLVVLIFSSEVEKSEWIEDEIIFARQGNISIIPFIIENVAPKGIFRFLTVPFQGIKAFTAPIEKHVERLIHAVKAHLEKQGCAA